MTLAAAPDTWCATGTRSSPQRWSPRLRRWGSSRRGQATRAHGRTEWPSDSWGRSGATCSTTRSFSTMSTFGGCLPNTWPTTTRIGRISGSRRTRRWLVPWSDTLQVRRRPCPTSGGGAPPQVRVGRGRVDESGAMSRTTSWRWSGRPGRGPASLDERARPTPGRPGVLSRIVRPRMFQSPALADRAMASHRRDSPEELHAEYDLHRDGDLTKRNDRCIITCSLLWHDI